MPKRPVTISDIENFQREQTKKKKQTTSKETWKLFERNVAKDFGTTRTPLSGMVKTITNSDTLHPKIYIECKLRGGNNFGFWEKFENSRKNIGVEVMCVYDNELELYVFTKDDFFKLLGEPEIKINLVSCVLKTKVYRSILTLFRETIDRAELEGKLPVVALKKKNKRSYLIGVKPNHLAELQKILIKVIRK